MRNGEAVRLGSARQRSLLAMLVVHANEVVSSDRLIDELWGEKAPPTANTALHGAVSQLRKALEPDRTPGADGAVLATQAPGYVLRIDLRRVDSSRFEQLLADGRAALDAGEAGRAATLLREALALWRGRALDGADGTPSVHAEAMRLDELRLEAVETRVDADLALGRDEELVSELEMLVERDPLRERLQAQLMLALYRAGRQADALEHYQRARNVFRDRLGIEPSPRLRELEQAMLRQDPELDVGLPRVRPRRMLRRRRRASVVAAVFALLVVAAAVAGYVLSRPDAALEGRPGSVAIVDPEAGQVVDTIEVGSGPAAIVYGHGSVWVANSEDDTVSRIDPESREVTKVIGAPSPVDLAVGPNAIWVAGGIDGSISRIDAESNDLVAEIDLRGRDPLLPLTVQGVAAGAGAAWAVVGRELVRVDPSTDRTDVSLDLGEPAFAIAIGHGSVWVLTVSHLVRIEPRSLAVTARTPIEGDPLGLEVADDGVVALVGATVSRVDLWLVDPDTAHLAQVLRVPGSAAATADVPGVGLWATTSSRDSPFEASVVRVDPSSGQVHEPVKVAPYPGSVAVGAGAVWVAIGSPEP